MATPTEAEIQFTIRQYLLHRGYLVIRINQGRKGNIPFSFWQVLGDAIHSSGTSDLLALSPTGRLIAVETKAPGEHASPQQTLFLAEAHKRGAACFITDDIDKFITELETQNP